MGIGKGNQSSSVTHFNSLKKFVSSLLELTTTQLAIRLKSLKNKEIGYISEIVLNFLNGGIRVNANEFHALRRMRTDLHLLSSRKSTNNSKKELLNSLKGLNILKILLPFTQKRLRVS